jgi:hypothetical protein
MASCRHCFSHAGPDGLCTLHRNLERHAAELSERKRQYKLARDQRIEAMLESAGVSAYDFIEWVKEQLGVAGSHEEG